jgi:RNA recognition motif-containing protein
MKISEQPKLEFPQSTRDEIQGATNNHNIKENTVNIFVGNLSREASEDDLKQAFQAFGEVATASIIMDKFTRESKGFGFVEMPVKTEAEAAIAGLNGKELKGRALTVNEARPREERGGGFGGRKGGGGGYGGNKGGGYGGGKGGGRRSW